MNVNINPRGHSAKGVTAYLMHDKDRARTAERVGQTETFNLYTDDIEKAAGWMAWVDGNREHIQAMNGGNGAGRPATAGNVYHFSIAWHPDDNPSWEHMRETGVSAISAMSQRALEKDEHANLSNHQFYFVEHTDEPHKHMHVVVSLVNPDTGKIHNCYQDREIMDRWAHAYEKGELVFQKTAAEYENLKGIQCEDRDKKYQAWEQDRDAFPDKEKRQDHRQSVRDAMQVSRSAEEFTDALEDRDLTLAQGKRRSLVIVDNQGDVFSLKRMLPEKPDYTQAVSDAYLWSDNGKSFQEALKEEGLHLHQGRRGGFVVADQYGNVQKLNQCVELHDGTTGRAKSKAINERLKDLDPEALGQPNEWRKDIDRDALPLADDVAAERLQELERDRERERDDGEGEGEEGITAGFTEASKRHDEETSIQPDNWDVEEAENARQNALLDAAEKYAQEKVEREQALAEKRRKFEERAKEIERQNRYREIQRRIDQKTQESRKRWDIDGCEKRRVEAEQRVQELSGFWSKIFRFRQIQEAQDNLRNRTLQQQERMGRHRTDIEAINARRPEWLRDQELKKHGFEPETRQPEPQRNQPTEPDIKKATPEQNAESESTVKRREDMSAEEFREYTKQLYREEMAAKRDAPEQENKREQERGIGWD